MKKYSLILFIAVSFLLAEPVLSRYTGRTAVTGPITLHLICENGNAAGTILFEKNGIPRSFYGKFSGDSLLILYPGSGYVIRASSGLQGLWDDGDTTWHLRLRRTRKVPYTLISYRDTTFLYPGTPDAPFMHYHGTAMQFPDLDLPGLPALNIFTQSREFFVEQASLYAADYAALRDIYREHTGGRSFFHYYEDQGDILYHGRKYISLRHRNTTFSGGAHPNTNFRHVVIDLAKGSIAGYDDLFMENTDDTIRSLLYMALKEKYSPDILFTRDFPVSRDIYVTKRGVVFQYDPYEIAPYYIGSIELFIPYGALRSVLR